MIQALTAEEDITCYKMVVEHTDIRTNTKTYFTPFIKEDITEYILNTELTHNGNMSNPVIEEKEGKIHVREGYIHTMRDKDIGITAFCQATYILGDIGIGRDIIISNEENRMCLYRCIIPKGTRYYEDTNVNWFTGISRGPKIRYDTYASERIRYITEEPETGKLSEKILAR